jgi:hypothetical protein
MNKTTEVVLTDTKVLKDLIDNDELTEEEFEAFSSMLDDLTCGKFKKLTTKQRNWAEAVHGRLNLDPGTANLVSSGKVKVTEKQKAELKDFFASLGPKRLRPPGKT